MGGVALGMQPLADEKAQDPSRAPKPGSELPRTTPEAANAPLPTDTLTPYQDRAIREVKLVGVRDQDMDLVGAQVRARVGSPLSAETVRGDVSRLTRLGRFKEILAEVTPLEDGSVELVYRCTPTPIIDDVQAVGNRQITDNELSGEISLLRNTPLDEFQLGSAANRIRRLYRNKGYYNASVKIEQEVVEDKVVVVFRIIEGDRVKITDIRFKGNEAFTSRQLGPNVKTETSGLFQSGEIDEEKIDQDVANIVTFYKDRGYLDIRADREMTFSPNGKEAVLTFLVAEGRVYTLREVKAVGSDPEKRDSGIRPPGKQLPPRVLSMEQLAGLMEMKPGDVYSQDKIRSSMDALRNAYARMGYVDARVQRFELRDENKPEVDLLLVVDEGRQFKAGLITVSGNDITQRKIILDEMDMIRPDRLLDNSSVRSGDRVITNAERKLEESRLFEQGSIKLTVQPEKPENPGYRDVLVEVKETNTGSFNFGAAVSSDAGVTGLISLNQRNFDVADTPDSFSEFISGRAFRGAGQIFNISLAPGTELQTYSISLTDPTLFDSDYSGTIAGSYRQREYDEYDEDRITGRLAFGRRFGERWGGNITVRAEQVDIRDIDNDSAVDLFEVEGDNPITGVGLNLIRNTLDSRFRTTEGTRLELGVERVGLLGGDFDFTKLSAEYVVYFPIYEDFLGRKTVMHVRTAASYIPEGPDEAPIFERYFLGGSTFRGFRFRTISPKGIRNDTGELGDDPVGGTWSFFAGTEIEQPVFQDVISVVGFLDTGTVTDDIGFDDYRVSVGAGLRFRVPFLGPAPLAFDFGFPLVKQYGDRERVFSFSIDFPF